MSRVLCDKKIPDRVKGKIHKMTIQPVMLYGLEIVPLWKKDVRRWDVAEMKMCRWACGHTLKDNVRNEDTREKMGIESIVVRCRKSQMRRFGHVKRRDEQYVGCRVKEMIPPGRRRQGRPKLGWMDCVRRSLEAMGAREEDALYRGTWTRKIATATLHLSGTS